LCYGDFLEVEHDAKDWQSAMEMLLLVAEHDGLARIGIISGHVERLFDGLRKDTHWGDAGSWRETND
jgi:hypothetical protein